MYNKKKILAVIPARSGSKGIKNKNIIKIHGTPLIDYTIKESLKSKYIDKVIVSTDSEKIAKIAKNSGAEVPFLRPESLACDSTKIIDVVIDLMTQTSGKTNDLFEYDYLVLLQPTQPLRESFHIDEAIEIIVNNDYKSLASVNLVEDHPILMRTINNEGLLESLLDTNSTVRRQDFPSYYKVNGSVYVNKIDEDFNENTSFNDNYYPYIMDSKYDLDIDEPQDLKRLEMNLSLESDDTI